MKLKKNNPVYLWLVLGLLALNIVAFILFQDPRPGVADQGDFDRVMNVSGLELTSEDLNNPSFVRFLNHPVTEYRISDAGILQQLSRLKTTSMSYLIIPIGLICKALGTTVFQTTYLAIAYIVLYLWALYIIIRCLNLSSPKMIMAALLTLFVLLDGNYLVWFNSLYGEPMMITTLLLYIAAWLYYIYGRYHQGPRFALLPQMMLIFFTAFLFLGSKMQVISALPIICLMIGILIRDNWRMLTRLQRMLLLFSSILLIVYPININMSNASINNITKYNSVFYGILKSSETPGQDLIDMGLNPNLAVDAGKHAFLPQEEYARYNPGAIITQQEFYSKITNLSLVKFYITHPHRLIQGLEYTASQAFSTSTFLGKYSQEYSGIPIRDFNRLTLWSNIREFFPKKLWFIAGVLLSVLAVSWKEYTRNMKNAGYRAKLELLWGIMLIGILQFPMPFVGNGYADTAKQLFLFNFIFDIMLVLSCCWLLFKLENITHIIREKTAPRKNEADLKSARVPVE